MSIYNQNDELIEIDENFINGFLTPIAMLRDYTTYEVGFNYYFKKLQQKPTVEESILEEFIFSFKALEFNQKNKSNAQLENLINKGIDLIEIENWEANLAEKINFWTGETLTNTINEEHIMSVWKNKPHLLSLDLIELLKVFFYPKKTKAFLYKGEIKKHLLYHWGGLDWLDILFSNKEEHYLLHFDLSD